MALPPLLFAKGTTDASRGLQKALTGDIYSKHWTEVVGTGKKAKLVEHEVHVNPVGIGLGAVALGAAALAAGAALWIGQMRIVPTKMQQYRIVVDVSEHTDRGQTGSIWHPETTVNDALLGWRCADGHFFSVEDDIGEALSKWTYIHHYHGLIVQEYGTRVIPGWNEIVMGDVTTPAVTHEEAIPGAYIKKFSIEERRGFSVADIIESAKDAIGVGSPWFGSWWHGQWQAGKKRLW
jgi:hypothetical protein